MTFHLSPGATVKQLKNQFAGLFANLKLEFFSQAHQARENSHPDYALRDSVAVGSISNITVKCHVEVSPWMSVADFEQAMRNRYQLFVQVYRKSGELWLQTTKTDNMTLEQQNLLGAASRSNRPVNFHTLFL